MRLPGKSSNVLGAGLFCLVLLLVGGIPVGPPDADAAEATLVQCHDPAQPFRAVFTRASTSSEIRALRGCSVGGSGFAGVDQDRSGGSIPRGADGRMAWSVPAGQVVTSVDARVRLRAGNGFRPFLTGRRGDSVVPLDATLVRDGEVDSIQWQDPSAPLDSVEVGIECLRSGGCPNPRDGSRAFAEVGRLRLGIKDDSPPVVEDVWSLPPNEWSSGMAGYRLEARDEGFGVASIEVVVNGYRVGLDSGNCGNGEGVFLTDFSPCPRSVTRAAFASFDRTPFQEGLNRVRFCATDYSGDRGSPNTGCSEVRTLRVDTLPPSPPSRLRSSPGEDWTPEREFGLSWRVPTDDGSPLVGAWFRVSDVDTGGTVDQGKLLGGEDGVGFVTVPGSGEFLIEVGMIDEAGNWGPPSELRLRSDDRPPPAPRLTGPSGWVSKKELPFAVDLSLEGEPGPSGIRGFAVANSDRVLNDLCTSIPCRSSSINVPAEVGRAAVGADQVREGVNVVSAVAVSGAGLPSPGVGSTEVRVDTTDPDTSISGGSGGWANGPVVVSADSRDRLSGMTPTAGESRSPETGIEASDGSREVSIGDSATLTVSREGVTTVGAWATDLAGNSNRGSGSEGPGGSPEPSFPAETTVRIDTTDPGIEFIRYGSAGDPELVEVKVTDRHSGPQSGQILIGSERAGGTSGFIPLQTTLDGAILRARIPSDDLATGAWRLRAEVVDRAGNVTISGLGGVSAGPVVQLPLKQPSVVVARFGSIDGPRRSTIGPDRTETVAGRVTDAAGNAGLQSEVLIEEHFPSSTGLETRRTVVATDSSGNYSLKLRPGPGRTVKVTFQGTATLTRASAGDLELAVRDRVALSIPDRETRNGRLMVMTGEVSAPEMAVPESGKGVVIQYFDPSRKAWRPVAVVRTDTAGRFRFGYRFRTITSPQRIRFRASSIPEAGWPFVASSSGPIDVVVRP